MYNVIIDCLRNSYCRFIGYRTQQTTPTITTTTFRFKLIFWIVYYVLCSTSSRFSLLLRLVQAYSPTDSLLSSNDTVLSPLSPLGSGFGSPLHLDDLVDFIVSILVCTCNISSHKKIPITQFFEKNRTRLPLRHQTMPAPMIQAIPTWCHMGPRTIYSLILAPVTPTAQCPQNLSLQDKTRPVRMTPQQMPSTQWPRTIHRVLVMAAVFRICAILNKHRLTRYAYAKQIHNITLERQFY